MTAPLSYLLGNNPTNTHYCLLCAQEECLIHDCNEGVVDFWEGGCRREKRDCGFCNGTGSKLVPIAEHDVGHEHVVATVRAMQGWWVKEQGGILVFTDGYCGNCHTSEAHLGGNPKAPYWETSFEKLSTRPITKADLWDMAKAVGWWNDLSGSNLFYIPLRRGVEDADDLEAALIDGIVFEFIAQGYETQKERVKG